MGATHSLLSIDVAQLLKVPYRGLGNILDIKTPSGRVHTTMMETDVLNIEVYSRKFLTQLILLNGRLQSYTWYGLVV